LTDGSLTPSLRRRRRRRRIRKWVVRSLATLLFVVVGFIAALLYVPAAARFTAQRGLAMYARTVAGTISIARIEGALGGNFELHGIAVSDRRGRPLVAVSRVRLGIDVPKALRGSIDLGTLEVEGLRVWLPVDDLGGWVDLSPPPSDAPIEDLPPTGELGPNLPVPIEAELQVRDVEIYEGSDPTSRRKLAVAHHLGLRLRGVGRRASTSVVFSGELPDADLSIERLEVSADWDEPKLGVPSLLIDTNWGALRSGTAGFDFERNEGTLAPLTASLTPERVKQFADIDIEGPTVLTLLGHGGLEHAHLALSLLVPGVGVVALMATGTTRNLELDLQLPGVTMTVHGGLDEGGSYRADVEVDAPSLTRVAEVAKAFVDLPPVRGDADVKLRCDGVLAPFTSHCRIAAGITSGSPVEQLELDVDVELGDRIVVDAHTLRARAQGATVELLGDQAHVEVEGASIAARDVNLRVTTGTGTGLVHAEGRWGGHDAHDLHARVSRLDLSAIEAFVPGLGLAGRLDAALGLRGTLGRPSIDVSVAGTSLAFRGHTLGDVQVTAGYAEGRSSARLKVRGGAVQTVDLEADLPVRLALDTPTPWALLEHGRPRLELAVTGANLQELATWSTPVAPIEGVVDVALHVAGRWQRPRLDLEVRATDLAFDGKELGDLTTEIGFADDEVSARLDLQHPYIRGLALTSRIPIGLDLFKGRASWQQDAEHVLNLNVREFDVSWIRVWVPALAVRGTLGLDLDVRGNALEPEIRTWLDVNEAAFEERELGHVAMQLDYLPGLALLLANGSGPAFDGLAVRASVPLTLKPIAGNVQWHHDRHHELELAVHELSVRDALTWASAPIDAEGLGRVVLSVAGLPNDLDVRTEVDVATIRYDGHSVGDLQLRARYQAAQAEAALVLVNDSQHSIRLDARAPIGVDLVAGTFAWRDDEAHHLELLVPKLDRELLDDFVELPDDLGVDLGVQVRADGSIGDFRAQTIVEGEVGPTYHPPFRIDLRLDANQIAQHLDLRVAQGPFDVLAITAETGLQTETLRNPEVDLFATPIRIRANANGTDLSILKGLGEGLISEPKGKLDLAIRVDGTLADRVLAGKLALREGAVTVVPMRQRFDQVELKAELDAARVELDSLSLRSGEGRVVARGAVDFGKLADIDAHAEIDIAKLPIRQPGLPRMQVDAKIAAKAQTNGDQAKVGVTLHDGKVNVALGNVAAPRPIPQSDRVHVVDLPPGATRIPRASNAASEIVAPPPPSGRFSAELVLADPVRIVGPSVDMTWGGAVSTLVRNGTVNVDGSLEAGRGGFDLLGNRFELASGKVTLPKTGELVPYLDILATTEVDAVAITATIRGRATGPTLRLTSQPPFPESEIFKMLVTGSSDTQSADPEEVQAQAASVLTAFVNPALQREIGQALYVDKIGASFGDSPDQPILSVGKNITKKVYAETQYHHNAPDNKNRAQLSVEYEFTPRWSLETFYGDRQVGGADVFWRWFFHRLRRAPDP